MNLMIEIEKWHGTSGGYSNHRCRCDDCRQAWREAARRRQLVRSQNMEKATHGKATTYTNYRCRCVPCVRAWSMYNAQRYQARKQAQQRSADCDMCHEDKPLVFDHDHETGEFRGWLCQSCNTGLGKLGDNLEGVLRAVAYLQRGYSTPGAGL